MMANKNCNAQFTKKDFIEAVRDAVKYSPIVKNEKKTLDCNRLQSFVILEEKKKITQENFGQNLFNNAGKNFFFQRKGKKLPALVVNFLDGYETDSYGTNPKDCCKVQIGVVDILKTDCANCGYCGKRTNEEIYCDIEDLIRQVDLYLLGLKNVRPYRLKDDGSKEYLTELSVWIHEAKINLLIEENKIDGVQEFFPVTQKLRKMLSTNNMKANKGRTTYGKGKYLMSYKEIIFCQKLTCKKVDWNFEADDKNSLSCC